MSVMVLMWLHSGMDVCEAGRKSSQCTRHAKRHHTTDLSLGSVFHPETFSALQEQNTESTRGMQMRRCNTCLTKTAIMSISENKRKSSDRGE